MKNLKFSLSFELFFCTSKLFLFYSSKMFSLATQVEQIHSVPIPGVEYDTVRGRGDFDAGYVNEYNGLSGKHSRTPKSHSSEFRHRRNRSCRNSSVSDDKISELSDPSQVLHNSAPPQKQSRRSKNTGKRNLPFHKDESNSNINEKKSDSEENSFEERILTPPLIASQWKQTAVTLA
ncbi:hypothetical protein TRFO_29288 [Tritrichomonas foetus]|uniref:Uncharacterized protein n=1 Tax=Tritrichomonas foetus TaxID=1144522 RepID=A0A1J4JXY2_9EUKA|nr:hypothetical protein TRFO_29288 [Tritrichomonas foetus]|eukprot:OHT03312.1 hypothetical protein TRFO_29288 [Tritrichomonas foetus]